MTEYRVYLVGKDGHFTGYELLFCANDAEALEKAKNSLDEDHGIEVWSGARLVGKLERKHP